MKVRFWGVRGSLPVPGPRTERYGGNTSCVEVITGAGTRIIIDAGTGIRRLGKELMQTEFESGAGRAHILVSHTHWDHIQGMPFFAPLYRQGNRFHVYARQRVDRSLKAVFAGQNGAPYFPVPFEAARADIDFREIADDAQFEVEDARVLSTRLNHPYIATAYAVVADGAKVAYVSDTAPFADILFGHEFVAGPPPPGAVLPDADRAALAAMRSSVVRLCEGADLVIYDTMFTADDYRMMPHYGHSRPADALAICHDAGARTLALYHHAPERSDDEVDAMLATARQLAGATPGGAGASRLAVTAAFEGMELRLGRT
jgi:phosphoribosyl 1,2-cyclic phosphodiesterase